MSTFLEAQDDLLDYINRPASEMRNRVKTEIKNTILWMQRMKQFHFAERLIRVTYPAGSLKINIGDVCDGRPRDYKNFQLLSSLTANEGLNLRNRSYSSLMMEKDKYQRSSMPIDFDTDYTNGSVLNEGSYANNVARINKHFVFFSGSDVGLYPTPSNDSYLLICLHVFLDNLSADGDTNFLLDNCYDFIVLKTLKRLNIFLKSEARIPIPAEEVEQCWQSVLQWDREVMIGDQPTQ